MKYTFNDILEVMSERTLDNLLLSPEFNLYIESEDKEKKSDNKQIKSEDTPKTEGKTGPVRMAMKGLSKGSEFIAKAIVRKPSPDASTEIQEGYIKRVRMVSAGIKVGVICVLKAPIAGPLDWVLTAAITAHLLKSDDPSDKMVIEMIKQLKDKAAETKNKLVEWFKKNKDKEITESDKNQYDALALQGLNIAKEMDAIKARIKKEKKEKPENPKNITESVLINKFDTLLINESGELVDNACDILRVIIEKTDYTKYEVFDVVEHYLNMII